MCRVTADVKDRIVDDGRVERERGDVDGGERRDERARVRRDVTAHRQRQRALTRARALAAAHRQQVRLPVALCCCFVHEPGDEHARVGRDVAAHRNVPNLIVPQEKLH